MNRSWFRFATAGIAVAAAFATGIAVAQPTPEPSAPPVGTCSVPTSHVAPADPRVYDGEGPMPIARVPLAF